MKKNILDLTALHTYIIDGKNMQNQKIYTFFNTIVSLRSQMVFIIITSSLLMIMGYRANKHLNTLEIEPQLLYITPKKISTWTGSSTPIKTGLYIENWVEFDLTTNNFIFDGIVWFEFDAQLVSIDTVDKFSFDNAKILEKTKSSTKIIGDLLHVEYDIRVQFNTKLVHTLFPFDDHTIYITLANKSLTPQEAIFEGYKSDFVVSHNAAPVEWKVLNRHVDTGYSEGFLKEKDKSSVINTPKAVFSFLIRRLSTRSIFVLFLPLFLLFFIGLLGFGFHPSQESIIRSLAASSIASIIGYRFVMQRMSPNVGYYILSDHVFSIVLSLTVIMLITSLMISQRKEESPHLILARGIIFLSFHATLLLMWYYLLFKWII